MTAVNCYLVADYNLQTVHTMFNLGCLVHLGTYVTSAVTKIEQMANFGSNAVVGALSESLLLTSHPAAALHAINWVYPVLLLALCVMVVYMFEV